MGRGGPHKDYTMEQVLAAIHKSGGIVSTIAKNLGCSWCTAKKWVEHWTTTRQSYEEELEVVADVAENCVLRSIQEGNTNDAKWYLAKKAKHRGYGDESRPGEAPVQQEIDLTKLACSWLRANVTAKVEFSEEGEELSDIVND